MLLATGILIIIICATILIPAAVTGKAFLQTTDSALQV